MMVPTRFTWLGVIFRYRGTELPRTKWRILGVVIVAVGVTILEELHDWHPDFTITPYSLVGLALGIFLGFRNNTAYDRWWEGRKIWGAMVNTARSFTRQILTHVGPIPGRTEVDPAELRAFHRELVYRVAAFVHGLHLNLRDELGNMGKEMGHLLSAEEIESLKHESNVPNAITQGTAKRLREAYEKGWIHEQHVPILEASMVECTNIQGGCERIKATPIPFSYTTLIHRITAVYCYTLPFGIVDTTKALTPIVCAIIAYSFFGLDTVGDEIEQPFGRDPNDLPLAALSRMIEVNVRQRLEGEELPPLHRPKDEILE